MADQPTSPSMAGRVHLVWCGDPRRRSPLRSRGQDGRGRRTFPLRLRPLPWQRSETSGPSSARKVPVGPAGTRRAFVPPNELLNFAKRMESRPLDCPLTLPSPPLGERTKVRGDKRRGLVPLHMQRSIGGGVANPPRALGDWNLLFGPAGARPASPAECPAPRNDAAPGKQTLLRRHFLSSPQDLTLTKKAGRVARYTIRRTPQSPPVLWWPLRPT